MSDCVFCQIVKGEMPMHKVHEDDEHLAFLSIFPNTPGFTILIPKKHYGSYAFDQNDEVLTKLMLFTKEVAKKIDKAFDDVGRCGMMFEGFGVDHLHSKLYPMHGTGNMEEWKPVEKERNTFYEQYPGYLSSHSGPRADDEELAKVAKRIREA